MNGTVRLTEVDEMVAFPVLKRPTDSKGQRGLSSLHWKPCVGRHVAGAQTGFSSLGERPF